MCLEDETPKNWSTHLEDGTPRNQLTFKKMIKDQLALNWRIKAYDISQENLTYMRKT